jgi:hypothetical protein
MLTERLPERMKHPWTDRIINQEERQEMGTGSESETVANFNKSHLEICQPDIKAITIIDN